MTNKQLLDHSNGNGNGNGHGKHHNGAATQAKDLTAVWLPPETKTPSFPTFKPNEQPVLLERPSWWSHAFVWGIIGVTASGLLWAYLAPIEQAVPAMGKLEAEGAAREVKAPNGGVVREIKVKDGDRVEKGQLLLTLDTTSPQADLDALKKQRETLLRENQFYSQVNNSGTVPASSELRSLFESRQALSSEIKYYQAILNGSKNPVSDGGDNLGSNNGEFNATHQGLLSASRAEIQSRVATVRSQIQQLETQLLQVRGQLSAAVQQLPKANERYLESRERLIKAQERLATARIRLATALKLQQTDEVLYKQIAPLVEDGAIARLQLQRQEQQILTRRQDVGEVQTELLNSQDEINNRQSDISTRDSEMLNTKAEIDRLRTEEKRIAEAISEKQQQLRNAIALSARDIFAKIADNQNKIAEIDSQIARLKLENQKKLAEIEAQLSKAQQAVDYQELRAPVDGVVFDLKPNSPGYVVRQIDQDPVLKIVPNNTLVAAVNLTNKDIGHVREGMDVDINVESFPSTEFGTIKGKLLSIGSDALPPTQERPFYAFPARVALERQSIAVNGKEFNLQSGMAVNATIKVRKRKVIDIFLELFHKEVDSLKTVR